MNWNIEDTIIFETLSGSQLYGTSTPQSDIDYRGVCIPPMKILLDPFHGFEQKDSGFEEEDRTIYNLAKYMKLCADGNPNIIELLFAPESCWKKCYPHWYSILDNINAFVSKKVKFTFTGYAFSQLHKIEQHRRWFIDPPKEKPTRKQFGLSDSPRISGEGLIAVANIAFDLLEPSFRDEVRRELDYRDAKQSWDNYISWFKGRNPKRKDLEDKYGYDCYLDDTEFLTENGWKLYDQISNSEKIATLNSQGEVEFHYPVERVKKPYSGKIYLFSPDHMECAVTPNHRMYISNQHRSLKNGFSTKYDGSMANWHFKSADDLLRDRNSYFHVRLAAEGKLEEYPISDETIILIGAYLSEGCVGKTLKNGDASVLRFSQKEGGRLCKYFDLINTSTPNRLRVFKTEHSEEWRNQKCVELTYTLSDKNLAKFIVNECGNGSKEKKLPKWTFELSKRQAKLLIEVMISGDGTNIKKYKADVYYTNSKKLADDLNALCIINGVVSQVWGPYNNVYQVYLSQRSMIESLITSKHVKEEFVENRYIVCFTVPNETLITRRNGKVAFQGNTKCAMHLFRLMYEGKELLLNGKITFPLIQADELLEIRNGKYSYDQVIEKAKELERQFDNWYQQSKLPHSPNWGKLEDLYFQIIGE